MATKIDKNMFALPWEDSNMVLVVEDQELHVHKWILTSQSPVFKAMFGGHLKEASQNNITLKEKDLQSMIPFLRLLYPSSMFSESKTPLNDESRLSVMALADEYQCVNLMKQCIDEAEITAQNVLQILPHAVKHHQTALPRMYDVIKSGVPTSKLKKFLPQIESKETSNAMLLTKCHFLESNLVQMQKAIISLLRDFLNKKSEAEGYEKSLKDVREEVSRLKELKDKNSASSRIYSPWRRSKPYASSFGTSQEIATVLTADS